MESRIRDLESEFDMESRRSADMEKNLRKAERQIKELDCLETDRHIEGQRMEKMISQLTAEMERLQTRLDEAHQIGALNLANYRLVDLDTLECQIKEHVRFFFLLKFAPLHAYLGLCFL